MKEKPENELLNPEQEYISELFDEFIMRYNGFGKEFYTFIKNNLPDVFSLMVFFRDITFQPNDSYAVYSFDKISFAIQLDPDCELIVLWNSKIHAEIGRWSKDPFAEGLEIIKSDLLKG